MNKDVNLVQERFGEVFRQENQIIRGQRAIQHQHLHLTIINTKIK